MIRWNVTSNAGRTVVQVTGLAVSVRNKARLLGIAGRRMVQTEIPLIFKSSGPGWPGLRPPPFGRSGQPLLDTGRLRDSLFYKVSGDTVTIGATAPGWRLHNEGWTVRPVAKKWLAIPLSPPLTVSERRVSRPRDFSNSVCWIKGDPNRGYEGPGIYRPTSRLGYSTRTHKPFHIFERIFALVKSVRIRRREYLKVTPAALAGIMDAWLLTLPHGGAN